MWLGQEVNLDFGVHPDIDQAYHRHGRDPHGRVPGVQRVDIFGSSARIRLKQRPESASGSAIRSDRMVHRWLAQPAGVEFAESDATFTIEAFNFCAAQPLVSRWVGQIGSPDRPDEAE